jgi:hypothetical protein
MRFIDARRSAIGFLVRFAMSILLFAAPSVVDGSIP